MNYLINGTVAGMNASARNTDPSANITVSMTYWGILPGLQTAVCPCVIILNGTLLFLFIIKTHLHQPFNIYLGNLLVANLCYDILNSPFDIINSVYQSWWLGSVACTAHLYGSFVVAPAIVHSHLLITVNRVWAVTFPQSYRKHNTMKMALVVCVAGWVYINCLVLPTIILDALYYRPPTDAGCFMSTEPLADYNFGLQFVVYLLPNIAIIAAYPYLWFTVRRRRFHSAVQPIQNGSANTAEHAQATLRTQASTASNAVAVPTHRAPAANRSTAKESHAFTVLTLLTISVTICWAPGNVVFTMGSAGLIQIDFDAPLFYVSTILFTLQPVLDPLFFAAALPDLRKTVLELFQWGKQYIFVAT